MPGHTVTSTLSATATSTARIGNDSGSQTSLAYYGNYNQGLNTTAVTTTVSGTASGTVAELPMLLQDHPLLQPTMFMNYIIKT